METLVENTIYRLDHNGFASVAYVVFDPAETIVYDTNRAWDITGWEESRFPDAIRYSAGDSYFEFSRLVLEDVPEIFPHTIRTFKDLESLTEFAKKVINMADSYTPNTEPDDEVSFTLDDEDNVLALIKVENEDGSMFYWENGDWVEIGEDEAPENVFERNLIDVEQQDIGNAIRFWTEAQADGSAPTKEDILIFAKF